MSVWSSVAEMMEGGLMLCHTFGAMAWVEWATVGFSIFWDSRDKKILYIGIE